MQTDFVIHRVNTIDRLLEIPEEYGVEIDIRAFGEHLVLNHEPFQKGDFLEDYLSLYDHGLLVLNIKEAGIEDKVIELVKQHKIENYFLLDCEFPYIYRASRQGVRNIAMRYSEDESIETALNYQYLVDWLWIDTNTKMPLDERVIGSIASASFNTCLVCPERWGREGDIETYAGLLQKLDWKPDAIMTSFEYVDKWKLCL